MAQELPYFRFTVQEWQNGDISLERYELQGLFISVCGFYWIQDCNVTLAMLQKKFSLATAQLQELVDLNILKHENRHDKVEIVFLNKQYDLLSEKRKSAQERGSMGGKAKAKLQLNGGYKDKDNNKDKDKDNLYREFLVLINEVTGREFKGDKKSKGQFNARIDEGATIENFKNAITICFNDEYHRQNPKYLTPEFITRSDKFQKYDLTKRQTPDQIKQAENKVFIVDKWKIEAQEVNGKILYGNSHQRNNGGLSEIGIRQHCQNLGISYD